MTLDNPVNLIYNGYSIQTNYTFVWDPPKLSGWDRFWRSGWGKAASVGLMVIAAVASIIVQNIPAFLWAVGGTLAFLGVGGVISGFISHSQGNSFWESFSTYVNQNIAQSKAISMVFLLATIGMSVIKNALITNKKSALSNAQNISKCFIKGTLVKTEEGDKAIEEIKVGDKVWAYDEETGDSENSSEYITCTPGHKFFLPENKNRRSLNEIHEHEGYELLSEQWVSAQHLKIGDKVLLENRKYGIIKSIILQELDIPETTYNFEVQDFHTYYVGEKGTLVHNAGGPCGGDLVDEIANQPDLGRKLDYAFGKATGSPHNIERSMSMQSQLSKIGIYDDVAGRSLLSNNLVTSYNTANNIAGAGSVAGSMIKDSLLAGPGGFLKV